MVEMMLYDIDTKELDRYDVCTPPNDSGLFMVFVRMSLNKYKANIGEISECWEEAGNIFRRRKK